MQVKLGLASIINAFKFHKVENAPEHLEIDPHTTTVVLSILHGVNVKIEKIKK